MIEAVRLAPYVAVHRHLSGTKPWLDCGKCLTNQPEQARAAFRCGYMPPDKWCGDGRTACVPGSDIIKPSICPGYSLQHPAVGEVADLWGWFRRGQLQLRVEHVSERLAYLIGLFNESMSGAEAYLMENRKPSK